MTTTSASLGKLLLEVALLSVVCDVLYGTPDPISELLVLHSRYGVIGFNTGLTAAARTARLSSDDDLNSPDILR